MVFIIWFRLRLPKRSSTKENDTMTLILAALLTACFSPESQPAGLGHDGGFDDSGTTSDGGGSDGGGTTDDGGSTTDGGSDGGGTDCEMLTWYYDADGDNFGGEHTDEPGIPNSPVAACEPPDNTDSERWMLDGGDCNDDPNFGFDINPDALEICGNDIDEDCNGDTNVVFAIVGTDFEEMQELQGEAGCISSYYDGDGDGFGGDQFCVCAYNDMYIEDGGDCEDGEYGAEIYPGAPGSGNDCNEW